MIKNIIIFLVVAVALYAAYRFLIVNNDPALMVDGGVNEGQMVASEFLVRLNEIESITFSRDLFEDARFRSLVSFGTAPDPVSAGRSNPFSR